MKNFVRAAAVIAAIGLTSGAQAATFNVDFNTGSPAGTPKTYVQNGFTFTSSSNGGVSLANNCPTGSPNSPCLQFGNNEIITVTYMYGLFDVDSFLFSGPGKSGDIIVSDGTTSTVLNGTGKGNAMTFALFTTAYDGLSSFTWQNVDNGSGRVDNIVFSVASVPLPAAGFVLLAGLGSLAALRRRKTA